MTDGRILARKQFSVDHSHFCMSYKTVATLVAQMAKNLPVMQKTCVRSLGWEDTLEEGMATHSSSLAWRIPVDRGQKSLMGYSPWVCKELDMTEQLSTSTHPLTKNTEGLCIFRAHVSCGPSLNRES